MTSILLAGPAIEPVSLAEARSWLRVDNTAEDELIVGLIAAARQMVESSTRRLLISQSWRIARDAWPADGLVRLPLAPFRSLDAVRTFSATGVASLVSPDTYVLDAAPDAARIRFFLSPPAPERSLAGIALDITVGYGPAAGDVPAPLRRALCMIAAHLYEHRGDDSGAAMPAAILALLAPYRRARLA